MGGSGRGGFLLVPQQRKGSLFLKALPFLETTCGILDASGGSVRSGGHVAHVSHSYLLAYCIPLHNFRYGIQVRDLHCAEKDAEALYDLLLRKGFAKDNCLLILGTEATQETVYDALKTFVLTKPRSDDLIIFYFAGHGLPISISNDEEDADLQSDVFLVTSNFDHQRIEGERGAW